MNSAQVADARKLASPSEWRQESSQWGSNAPSLNTAQPTHASAINAAITAASSAPPEMPPPPLVACVALLPAAVPVVFAGGVAGSVVVWVLVDALGRVVFDVVALAGAAAPPTTPAAGVLVVPVLVSVWPGEASAGVAASAHRAVARRRVRRARERRGERCIALMLALALGGKQILDRGERRRAQLRGRA